MGRSDDIKGIRDAIVATTVAKKVSKGKRAVQEQAPVRGTNQRFDWDEWIADVSEAVDQFIGMSIEVLPRVPWKKWYDSGMSAVVAAKSAVQMYEDSHEDGAFDFATDKKRKISEQYPVGRDSYGEWTKKVSRRIEKLGGTLVSAMERAGMTIEQLHDMYNAEYEPVHVANALWKSSEGKPRTESRLRKRMKALDEIAKRLGMRLSQMEEEDEEEDEEEEVDNEEVDDEEPERSDEEEDEDAGEDENGDEQEEDTDEDGPVKIVDEDLGVMFLWPLKDPDGHIGVIDLKTENVIYSWGLRGGKCGPEVYEDVMKKAAESMRQDGRDAWLRKQTAPTGMPVNPSAKPDLGRIDYREENAMLGQLGAALGKMNAETDDGNDDGDGQPMNGETD